MKKNIAFIAVAASVCWAANAQNYTSPFTPLNLLDEHTYDLIAGEASGEQAYYHILELAPYEKDRKAEEYQGELHETTYVYGKLKEYGLPNVQVERLGKVKTWDGVSATLWEVSPKTSKIADYRDLTAFLAQGSANADVQTQLVWVGRGTSEEIKAANVKGKIIVTETAGARVHNDAVQAGAAGIISYYAPRPLIDPIQIPNASIPGNSPIFCFNLPPREGYALKDRLTAGDSIVVHAKVETASVETDLQIPTCYIPGTDSQAGEVLLSAHLFEGYVKLGANDNSSGAAAILDVARTLNQLIEAGDIPRPKRNIRFLWIPEISGSAAWANQHKDITAKTLCVLNLDMVGLWLSKSNSYLCLHRTTMGNPHYVNDVTEALFHYVGATNKGFTATGAGRPEPLKPIFSITGSHDPFYYSVGAHQGSSDHEVFNDFSVGVPAIMMVTWPDNYYHTSGDRPEICDPTQLRRSIVIAATAAYLIASASEEGALRIAGEVSSNAVKRLALIQQLNAKRINEAKAEDLQAVYKRAVFDVEAYAGNEKATLLSIPELTPASTVVKKFIDTRIADIQKISKLNIAGLEESAKARAEVLHSPPLKPIALSEEEQKASKRYPQATSAAGEAGFGALRNIPPDVQNKYNVRPRNGGEILRLARKGTNSVLDIKKLLDAQFPHAESLEEITLYLELLKELNLISWRF
ncbi:MAG: M28 family peptidase [Tannerellaceae bacterium]|jgi:hypothetical protein|nr:M28 family peptidase [Tannerellaceae bacterium]